MREINRCLSPELIRSSKYFWISDKRSASSPWSSTTACKTTAPRSIRPKNWIRVIVKKFLGHRTKNEFQIPLVVYRGLLIDPFSQYTKVRLKDVKFPEALVPLNPTREKINKRKKSKIKIKIKYKKKNFAIQQIHVSQTFKGKNKQ